MNFLIADDMYTNRLRIGVILKNLGHTFEEAVDGEDALKKINAKNFDIVLMDIEMPRMNGFETLQCIREELPINKRNLPVIIISSHGSFSYFKDYDKYGYNAILTKPFTEEKFEKVLSEVFKTNYKL